MLPACSVGLLLDLLSPPAHSVSVLWIAVLIAYLCLVFMADERHSRRGAHHG
jgi:hypothetical protein